MEFCRPRYCGRTLPGMGLFLCTSFPKEPTRGDETSLGEFVAELAVLILGNVSPVESQTR